MRAALLLGLLVLPALLGGCTTPRPGPPWPGAMALAGDAGRARTSALPIVALRLGDGGALEGLPAEMRGLDYCGHHNASGMRADYRGDLGLSFETLREPGAWNASAWYADKAGQPVRPADLPPGSAALVRWRTPADWNATGQAPLLLVLLHLERAAAVEDVLAPERVATLLYEDFLAFPASAPASCCLLTSVTGPAAGDRLATLADPCSDAAYDPYRLVPADVPPHRVA